MASKKNSRLSAGRDMKANARLACRLALAAGALALAGGSLASCRHLPFSPDKAAKSPSPAEKKTAESAAEKPPAAGCPGPHYLRQGGSFFQQGRLGPARSCFEKLNYGAGDFAPALLEIQKINYTEKDWTRFFGLAVYYRGKLLATKEMAAKNFHQEMLALELLALLRHCRFEEALAVLEWGLRAAAEAKKDSSKIQKAADFLKLKERVGDRPRPWTDWERRARLWPVQTEQIISLDNPKRARARVKSKC